MIKGQGFIMRSVEDYETAQRLADPDRAIRRRMSGLQMAILRFLQEEGATPYGEVRQEVMGKITPSRKASFSRSVRGLKDKRMICDTPESGDLCLMLHPNFAAYIATLER